MTNSHNVQNTEISFYGTFPFEVGLTKLNLVLLMEYVSDILNLTWVLMHKIYLTC